MKPSDLRAELAALGWSQADFAERLGVHVNTVNKWATGKAEIPGPAIAYLILAVKVRDLAKAI